MQATLTCAAFPRFDAQGSGPEEWHNTLHSEEKRVRNISPKRLAQARETGLNVDPVVEILKLPSVMPQAKAAPGHDVASSYLIWIPWDERAAS